MEPMQAVSGACFASVFSVIFCSTASFRIKGSRRKRGALHGIVTSATPSRHRRRLMSARDERAVEEGSLDFGVQAEVRSPFGRLILGEAGSEALRQTSSGRRADVPGACGDLPGFSIGFRYAPRSWG